MTIAVLIPCFNEAMTIAKVVSDYRSLLPNAKIYVFDNNSNDGSIDIASRAGAIVHRVRRQGKGCVVAEMFCCVDADVYLIVDGDDTYKASDVSKLIIPVQKGIADMVIGDRLSGTYFTVNKRPFHNFGNRFVRFLVNRIFKSDIHDVMTGARAFSRTFVREIQIISDGFEIETELTIYALDKKMSIVETPVGYQDRPRGSISKLNTIPDGIQVLQTIFTLFKAYRPLRFFSNISAIMLICSVYLFVSVLESYINNGAIPKISSLVVPVTLAIVGLIFLTCGIVLNSIKKYNDDMLVM